MKKFILLQLTLLLAMGSCTMQTTDTAGNEQPATSAQEQWGTPGHLTFKGVPIDGSLQEFVSRMENAGFMATDARNGVAYLQGDFAGYKNCVVKVTTIKPRNIVSTIDVLFPSHYEWSALESDYENLKSMLTQKYGNPSESKEEFSNGLGRDNMKKITQLRDGKCTWYTIFNTPNGNIRLSLEHRDFSNCFVQLRYSDRLNSEAVRQQAINDL